MIKTHEDLLNKLHNVQSLDFISDNKTVHGDNLIFVGTNWKEYIVQLTNGQYAISINRKHAQTVSENKPCNFVDNILLIVVDTPQEVFDYFKPFMR